ncbi:subtilisin-like serine protease PR1C [Metarhizium guizhouense ARSEF 977]|uniref:Subtilisin-like serine protease PR1C n=1 Tax=Metarhizium guizhouense (strain ARSEF 977) TaxID=1276136 RepID=A0A0B4GSD1_METGA|nr:subtilisin-like serine protease PR1C [Metarhizium guizhouense ARSEF 977]
MVCSSWFAFLALGVIGASPAWAAENGIESTKLADDALILECESSQACESVATAVEASGGALRHIYNSDVFHGVSFQLPESTTVDDRKALVAQFKGIKASWPVEDITLVPEGTAKDQPEDKLQVPKGNEEKRAPLGRRADDDGVETPWNHLMTHMDKLHEEGYLGSGIKIAVIDTGVDYNHPALGGCFGPGCRVVTGENFSNQGNRSDPIDCTHGGHGTIVAGILAGYNKADGFVGAAPNATIMAYRVLNCNAEGREDDMIAGWLKAKKDGAQIIVSSSGFQGENWAQRPLAVVAARIVASGVPCVVGLGNHKEQGLFYAMNPSTGRGVTSVNSFGRSLVALEHRGEYSVGNGSETVDFAFEPGRGRRDWDGEWRPVHDVDADFGDKPDDDLTGAEEVPDYLDEDTVLGDNCKLSPGNSSTGFAQDLVGHIALIRQTPETNGCHFYDRVRNAVARGAAHILAWQDAPNNIMIRDSDAHGVKAIGITQTNDGRAMARALASGQPLTARRAGRVRINTGVIAPMSAYGPTWDMDIKPTIGAPGHKVPVTRKGGGYSSNSGTSFAGPLVAGVFALVAEARGTFDPALLNSLITSTGAPQSSHGRLITVAQQGGGLLRAWEAAHATTLVEPSTLPFNDTDHRPDSIGLRITNTAKTEVTYRLSHLAATTLYTLESDSIRPSEDPAGELDKLAIMDELDKVDEAVDAAADVKISQSSLTLGPGQSATVDVSATDPSGLAPERLPLWSGWVSIQGSDGTNLTVPYLGLGGSLRSAAVLDPASKLSTLAGSEFLLPNPPEGQTPGPSQGIAEPAAAVRSEAISTSFDLVLGSPQVRVDIVPLDVCSTPALVGTRANATEPDLSQACVPDSIVTEFAGVKSIGQLPGYPKHYAKREEIQIHWDGAFAEGQYAPPGRYKIVARALSIMGDAADGAHWQTVESPVFSILYERNVKRAPENQPAQPAQTPEEEDAPAANAGDALAADDVKPAPES